MMAAFWGMTTFAVVKGLIGFTETKEEDKFAKEGYNRLQTVFQKNKIGYYTRIMSDFDIMLEALLNERFIDESTLYYDDPNTAKEVEDIELGLNHDVTRSDLRNFLHDADRSDHSSYKALRFPDRVGTNYEKSDALSCYKILPKGQKPVV